jgi:hypothetical protein
LKLESFVENGYLFTQNGVDWTRRTMVDSENVTAGEPSDKVLNFPTAKPTEQGITYSAVEIGGMSAKY